MKEKNVFAGTGRSTKEDAYDAGKEAAQSALDGMKGKKPDMAFFFVSVRYENDWKGLLKGMKSVIGDTPNIGTSTMTGECSNQGWTGNSITVMLIASDFLHFGIGVGKNVSKNPEKAGETAAKHAMANLKLDRTVDAYAMFNAMKTTSVNELTKIKPFFFLTFPAGGTSTQAGHEEEILLGMQKVIGRFVPIFGGSSSDDWRMQKNYQFCNGKVYSDSIATVAISSSLRIGTAIRHGFEETNKRVFVSEAKGHVVKKLNDQPAARVWADIMDVDLPELKKKDVPGRVKECLEVSMQRTFGLKDIFTQNTWLRVAKNVNDDDSMEFYPFVPLGVALARMNVNIKKAKLATKEAVEQAVKEARGDVGAVLVFSCGLRCSLLGSAEEKKMLDKAIKNIPYAGFSTEGEQGYFGNSPTGHHNITIVAIAFGNKIIGK